MGAKQGGTPPTGAGPGSSTGGRPQLGAGVPAGGRGSTSEITSWVSAHFSSKTVGGQTNYDLTKATS